MPRRGKLAGGGLLLALAVGGAWLLSQWLAWSPYRELVLLPNHKAAAKWWLSLAITRPGPALWGEARLVSLAGRPFLAQAAPSPETGDLLAKFPLPPAVRAPGLGWRERVALIRHHASLALPQGESPWPQSPEPARAVELLGDNAKQAKYPRLCSKLAKIFVQYLAAVGETARIVDLREHTAAEVYNPAEDHWEYHDPFFDAPALGADGRHLSAAEAHDRLKRGEAVAFPGPAYVFDTVVTLARNNFAGDKLPAWHYFHYDHLTWWRVERVSPASWQYWQDRLASGR